MELEMIGNVYGRLTVVNLSHTDAKYNKFWNCNCTCGNTSVVRGSRLTTGKTKSCGCYAKEFRDNLENTAKTERRNITRRSYALMLDRCYNENYQNYSHFGGAGITVCDRWRFGDETKTGWECFFADMGPKPKGYILGRKIKTEPYQLNNCVWTTSNNQFADITRSGRPRKVEKEEVILTPIEAWIKRCLANPKRKALTSEYLNSILETHCPLMGVELTYTPSNNTGITRNYATLDRIDSSKGYEVGNVQIISHRANMIKNDATLGELELIIKNWKSRL